MSMEIMFPSSWKACQRRYVFASRGMPTRATATESQLLQVRQTGCGWGGDGGAEVDAIGVDILRCRGRCEKEEAMCVRCVYESGTVDIACTRVAGCIFMRWKFTQLDRSSVK